MKRKIALLILLVLALTLVFVACNRTPATAIRLRWEDEKHIFNISLADFTDDNTNSFKYYTNGNESYYKDIAMSGEFNNWDEIRPLEVKGKYTVEITRSSDRLSYSVETTQEMCVRYDLRDIKQDSQLNDAVVSADRLTDYGMTTDDKTLILWSLTQTGVTFENTASQKPLSSWVKVDGFYAGKSAQLLTNYELKTEYNYSKKRPVAKITLNGETSEYKFGRNSAGNFIDSNQILLYLRSLDKSSSSFQDSPAINVFNPFNQSLQRASFGLTANTMTRGVILTDPDTDGGLLATNLNVLSVTVGNHAFMVQENLPDSLAEKNLDLHITSGSNDSKFTTVRFRVGYLAYEMDYSNGENTTNWSEILEALSPTPINK